MGQWPANLDAEILKITLVSQGKHIYIQCLMGFALSSSCALLSFPRRSEMEEDALSVFATSM
jgi:hypothetical protein